MLDDGVKQNGSDLRVADVATLLAEALDASPSAIPDPDEASRCDGRARADRIRNDCVVAATTIAA